MYIPERPKEKKLSVPPEFVRFVMGKFNSLFICALFLVTILTKYGTNGLFNGYMAQAVCFFAQ